MATAAAQPAPGFFSRETLGFGPPGTARKITELLCTALDGSNVITQALLNKRYLRINRSLQLSFDKKALEGYLVTAVKAKMLYESYRTAPLAEKDALKESVANELLQLFEGKFDIECVTMSKTSGVFSTVECMNAELNLPFNQDEIDKCMETALKGKRFALTDEKSME